MRAFAEPIYVTRPALPPLTEYVRELEEIWASHRITNRGPLLERFERRLGDVLQVENLSLFTNGTLALVIGLQGLGLSGEVITTPFTFPATANALMQNAIEPVFADIDPLSLTLDPDCVEAAITPRTTGILAVHLFGRPCHTVDLADIAERHGLLLIYDAAHAFGVEIGGKSIAGFGDLSMFSFHGTKAFHSIEGGALAFRRPDLKQKLDAIGNHGLTPGGDLLAPGTNAKMTEFQAAMGLLMLERFPAAVAHMESIAEHYRMRLAALAGITLPPPPAPGVTGSNGFMPILVEETAFGMSPDQLAAALTRFNVFPRRYFSPLVSEMRVYRRLAARHSLSRAAVAARRVLALPTYTDLALEDVDRICDIIGFIQAAGPSAAPST